MDTITLAIVGDVILCAVVAYFVVKHGKRSPFDHDSDGRVGGSLPAAERGFDDLVEDYILLYGTAPDHRWGASVLCKKIAARH